MGSQSRIQNATSSLRVGSQIGAGRVARNRCEALAAS